MQFVLHCSYHLEFYALLKAKNIFSIIMPRLGTMRLWMRDFYQKKTSPNLSYFAQNLRFCQPRVEHRIGGAIFLRGPNLPISAWRLATADLVLAFRHYCLHNFAPI